MADKFLAKRNIALKFPWIDSFLMVADYTNGSVTKGELSLSTIALFGSLHGKMKAKMII